MSYEDAHGKARLPDTFTKEYPHGGHGDTHGVAIATVDPADRGEVGSHGPSGGRALVAVEKDGLELHRGGSASPALPDSPAGLDSDARPANADPPLRRYAAWYQHDVGPHRAGLTAAHFKAESVEAGRAEEAALWTLIEDLLDGERGELYHPDAIGLARLPPHRRWFRSQYAHLQGLLQGHPVLRRACVVCRWLEGGRGGTAAMPRLQGRDDVVMRQLLLGHLRRGELQHAIDVSVAYGDARYACTLAAARLRNVREGWFAQTAHVPLFGEYANGEEDGGWSGNEARLRAVAQFFADSRDPRGGDLDAVIGALLSGHLEVLEPAFAGNDSWRDTLWCFLRCSLVVAFTKTLINANVPVEQPYAAYIEQQVGCEEDWVESFTRKLVVGLQQRVKAHNFLSRVKLEEQLELRFILQMLSLGGSYDEHYWFDIRPEVGNREATRLITHLLLVLDTAYLEQISFYDVQAHAGDSLSFSMAQYSMSLALLPLYPFEDGLRAMVAMARRLRNPQHRAQVYAAFVRAVRDSEFEHEEMSREQIEEQEARLVRMFVELDPNPATRTAVQMLLDQQIGGDELLTHNKMAEQILWEAMHAYTTEDYMKVLVKGLEACVGFWLTTPQPELNAITDVSRILMQRVMPALEDPTKNGQPCSSRSIGAGGKRFTLIEGGGCSEAKVPVEPVSGPLSAQEWSEAVFWYVFSEARALSKEHAKSVSALEAARATFTAGDGNRTLLFQLSQNEIGFMTKLVTLTQRAIRHGGAVVHRSRQCLSAVMWLLQVFVEDVTLNLLNSDNKTEGLELMQTAFGFLEELNEAGYLDPSLLLQETASTLFTSIRAMRVAYGQLAERKHVEQLLQRANIGHTSEVVVRL